MRKGMFFGISIALLLAAMLFAVGIWSSTQQVRETGEVGQFKALALRSLGESVSKERIMELSEIFGRRALYNLNWHIRHSGKYSQDPAKDFGGMLIYGRCRPIDIDGDGKADITKQEFISFAGSCYGALADKNCQEFDINGDGAVDQADSECFEKQGESRDSFAGFGVALAEAANERGFVSSIAVKHVELEQAGPWAVNMKLEVDVEIEDLGKSIGIEKHAGAEVVIPIDGLEDPLIGVESARMGYFELPGQKKSITKFEGEAGAKNITKRTGAYLKGEGWAYGTVARIMGQNADKSHILVVKEATEQVAGIANGYSGVIVETSPVVTKVGTRKVETRGGCTIICEYDIYEEISNCLDCARWSSSVCGPGSQAIGGNCPPLSPPEILELTGKNTVSVPYVQGVSFAGADAVLFDSGTNDSLRENGENGNAPGASVWNIEGLRSLSLCNGYVVNSEAPDFLQRLSGETGAKSKSGIESLLNPQLAFGQNGARPGEPEPMADYIFYGDSKPPGFPVKGMPGCRSPLECAANWPKVFALDDAHIRAYGVGGIACIDNHSPC